MTDAHVGAVLFYFVYPFVEEGAQSSIVDTAGHGGGYTQQGLGCWPTMGLFGAPDLHLQPMLFMVLLSNSKPKFNLLIFIYSKSAVIHQSVNHSITSTLFNFIQKKGNDTRRYP